jgi:hypothetical protein
MQKKFRIKFATKKAKNLSIKIAKPQKNEKKITTNPKVVLGSYH